MLGPCRSTARWSFFGVILTLLAVIWTPAPAQPARGGAAPVGTAQPASVTAASATAPAANVSPEYRINPLDRLNITVFQVPALSQERVQVDASGQLAFPLIGSFTASGRTAGEVASEISRRLSERYLRNPQVSVTVTETISQKVTVEGAVMQPGVYDLRGRTGLQEAIAMARGPSRTADIRRVAIMRNVNGERRAAIFDLRDIRNGRVADPEIQAGDTVVIQDSRSRVLWQNIIQMVPLFSIIR